jgi:hypothetical protein
MRPYLALPLMLSLLVLFALTPFGTPTVQAELPVTVIGFSQGGLPLVVHHVGSGSRPVLVLGGQHGGPEANTTELAIGLRDYFAERPTEVPARLRLDLLTVANPDGAASGSRQFLSGVDPNRNWGGPDWRSDTADSNGVFRPGLGGTQPFSEQETQALRDWIVNDRPALVINFHSQGGFMYGPREGPGAELAELFAASTGYYFPTPSGPRLLGYSASGSMNVWLREQGVPAIFVELSNSWDPELARNLDGLRAVLNRLGDEVAAVS